MQPLDLSLWIPEMIEGQRPGAFVGANGGCDRAPDSLEYSAFRRYLGRRPTAFRSRQESLILSALRWTRQVILKALNLYGSRRRLPTVRDFCLKSMLPSLLTRA